MSKTFNEFDDMFNEMKGARESKPRAQPAEKKPREDTRYKELSEAVNALKAEMEEIKKTKQQQVVSTVLTTEQRQAIENLYKDVLSRYKNKKKSKWLELNLQIVEKLVKSNE